MNIPKIILNDRKIISSDVYHYYQSLAQRLIMKKRNSNININQHYSKEKIFNWFSNLDIKQKFKICSIYNNWFSNIIFQMMEYYHYDSVVEFFPTNIYQEFKKNNLNEFAFLKNELNEIANNEKKQNLDNFITFFIGENIVKKSIGVPDEYELVNIDIKFHQQNLFFAELRFITLDELNDTISFSYDLFNHPERLFEFFSYFSKDNCFTSIVNPIQEKNNCYNFSFPNWIYNYQSYSLCQILFIFFEQIISVYYQLYLYDKEIPQFNIDKKLDEFFKTNENIKKYLSQKNINNDDSIIDKQKCYEALNSKIIQDKYLYYENKSKTVHSIAFGISLYEQYINKQREFNIKFNLLMDIARKNSNDFVDKISLIEAKESFKYPNFIYHVIYQQLIKQWSDECYKELLIEEENKAHNETITSKSKKNRRKKKKKKKGENENKEIQNINENNNIEDYNEEDKEEKNIIDNNEEEIEEIPADYIIHPKTEQNMKESEENNINIINNNDINNSTVSSSYTNKYSKENYNLGPRINNFFKCEKKESEILLEIEDFRDDKSEESNDEKEKNNKIELEDISENDISEENSNNKNINNTLMDNSENKKKKKKHKKRNKKKKDKNINDNINDISINNNKNNNVLNLKEKEDKNNINTINNIKKNEMSIIINNKNNENINIKNNKTEIKPIIKEKNEIKANLNLSKVENISITKEKKDNDNIVNKDIYIKLKESMKEDKEKPKRKDKEFFLFPVNTKKKDKAINSNNKKNEKKVQEIVSNCSINTKNQKEEERKQLENNNNNKIPKDKFQKDNKEGTIKDNKLNSLEISNVANIKINADNKKSKDNITFSKNDSEIIGNNIFGSNKSSYINPLFYNNFNNSFLVYQNEMFSCLGKDILKFQKIVENNLKEIYTYRKQVINKIKKFIYDNLSNKYFIKFLFYGSYSTGLSIESSDIDILIEFQKKEKDSELAPNSTNIIHDLIFQLNEDFKRNISELKIDKINPIYTASIPVLKIECLLKDFIPPDVKDKLTKTYLFNFENEILKLNFDFTFLEVENIDKEQEIHSQQIINYIKDFINIYPSIKPIILVLKRYMQIKKLNSSYHGGISSFSLFLLVASYNKQIFNENKFLDKNKDFESLLGQIFYGFFMFYSNFNFRIHSINLKMNNPITLLNEFNENNITIIDPITGLNAAKSTFKLDQIKFAFNNAIIVINEIFFNSSNYFDNDNYESDIVKKLLFTNNFGKYFY